MGSRNGEDDGESWIAGSIACEGWKRSRGREILDGCTGARESGGRNSGVVRAADGGLNIRDIRCVCRRYGT